MAREFAYPVVLARVSEETYVVSSPDLPELLTEGPTREAAVREAVDALEEAVAARIRLGEDIPEASTPREDEDFEVVRLSPTLAAKAALSLALRDTGRSQSALARELGVDEKEIRRLLDPRFPSKMPRLLQALELVGGELQVSVVDKASTEISRTQPTSYRKLDLEASHLATSLFPDEVREGTAIPVMKALRRLKDVRRFCGLPCTPAFVRDKALAEEGVTEFLDRTLRIRLRDDVVLRARQGNPRSRFTAAHELAHAILHHSELATQNGRAFRDPVCTATEKLPSGVRIFESPDWQANNWAGAFLMPFAGILRYCERLAAEGKELEVESFAANFQVSVKAAEIRLQKTLPRLLNWAERKGGDAN
jgi:antitoxin HicB